MTVNLALSVYATLVLAYLGRKDSKLTSFSSRRDGSCMQCATAIDTLEQTTRNSSKSIGSMDRAVQSLSLRASQVICADPMRDTTDRLLIVMVITSTTGRQ